ncbi:hypothetical protein E3P92_02275 [Wallemia ichthyophaga]|nr:hypothetical protein E3P92_02275 [Wallemia ichthyophaga]TIB63306.1 hypothetical protein E3P78_01871 [Wallemia ichthyophaga]
MPNSIASSAKHLIEDDTDDDTINSPLNVDPNLRLRTVRSASSSIREAHRHDKRRESKRKRLREKVKKAANKLKDKNATVPDKSPVDGNRRNVYANIPLPPYELSKTGDPIAKYPRNKVRTAKYTLITFIPKNLLEQFRRVANIYFLLLVILQIFPIFGATTPQVAMLPLVAILVITGIKDAIEDYRRNVLDSQVNHSVTTKLNNFKNVNIPEDDRSLFEKTFNIDKGTSRGVRKLHDSNAAGLTDSVLYMHGNKADTMTSLTPSNNTIGVVDYANQTPGTSRWERTFWKKLQVGDFVLLRENDQIPADVVLLSTSDPDGMAFVETKNLDGETNLKPKKCLKATSGLCSEEDIEHSQFLIDSEPPNANLYSYNGVLRYKPRKTPESTVTQEAVEPATASELLLRGCSLRNTRWAIGFVVFTGGDTKIMLNGGETPSKRSKIEKETNFNVAMNFIILIAMCAIAAIANDAMMDSKVSINSLITFCACLIAFQNIVPISLYISIEIVKTIQAFFIWQDLDMYYPELDHPCVPKSWNISDDLGQIEYIFSDKTGTLTQNVMEFKKCSIAGKEYGEGITEAMLGAAKREGRELNFNISDLIESDRKHSIYHFFRALAICHDVIASVPDDSQPFKLEYKAQSPDEAALVATARDMGFAFVNRSNTWLELNVCGNVERYTPLKILEFNSSRKRMSVVVRTTDGRNLLLCKGADSVISERLRVDHDRYLFNETMRDLEEFANSGLRTLLVAQREVSQKEYHEWEAVYDKAAASITDREEEIEKSCDLIERDLVIVGATALEDKLQEGVPDSIQTLHKAGIKLWILTGDKVQTAIEIGFSCNLLDNGMEIMILSAENTHDTLLQIESSLNKLQSTDSNDGFIDKKYAVVVDGETLKYALNEENKSQFLNLGTQCETVLCCRVSPSQKAQTVSLVKEGKKAMTLSIGDGANDVAMIQQANIGIGIAGLEGAQASMSADYAIGQFRYLTHLLLVHGRWSYIRIAEMHANFFFKNIIFTLIMFLYLIYCSFDATYLFEYTYIMFYNLLFTSLPVIIMGAFEQDVNATASLAFPQLYKRGIAGLEYTRTKFWLYMLDGCYQACVCFFVAYGAYIGGTTQSYSGRDANSLWEVGVTICCTCVLCANGYVGLNTKYWTWMVWTVNIVTTLLVFIWTALYSAFDGQNFHGEVIDVFSSATFWFTVVITPVIALAPRFIIKLAHNTYMPMDKDIIRERWIVGHLKDELGVKHRREIEQEERQHKLVAIPEDVEMGVTNGHASIASFGLGRSVDDDDDSYVREEENGKNQLQLPPLAVWQPMSRSVTSSRTTPYNIASGSVSELEMNEYPPTSPVRQQGGKNAPRRKQVRKPHTEADDQKIQAALKKINVQHVPGIDEVNMFKEDGNVIHFAKPIVHSAESANTTAVYGRAQNKELTELVPGILPQLGADSLANLRRLAEQYQQLTQAQQQQAVNKAKEDGNDDDVPDLVENFENGDENKNVD